MKNILKILVSFVVIFVAFMPAFSDQFQFSEQAQPQVLDNTKTPKIGVTAGANYSNLYVSEVDSENAKVGFHAGLFFTIPLSERIVLQPELLYSTKGSELTYTTPVSGTASLSLNYIDLPIMFIMYLSNNLNIQIGPYISYLTSVSVENKSGTSSFAEQLSLSNFQSFDYGAIAGIEYATDFFSIYLKYNYGLLNVGVPQEFFGTTYSFPNAKNSVAQLGASISFGK